MNWFDIVKIREKGSDGDAFFSEDMFTMLGSINDDFISARKKIDKLSEISSDPEMQDLLSFLHRENKASRGAVKQIQRFARKLHEKESKMQENLQ